MSRSLTSCLLALALASTTARPVRAQVHGGPASGAAPRPAADPAADVARARELFVEGSRLAESSDWDGARDRFERSLKLKRAALTLYNLGIAQQETGRLVAAVDSFRAFLALPVEPATQAYVEPVRTVVAMLEARVARVEVDIRPAGLRGLVLRVDGREAPAAVGARRMDPGHHDFVASAPGSCDAYVSASLAEGARSTIALRLVPVTPPPAGVALPVTLAAGGLALLVGGSVTLGVGAARGLGSPPRPDAPRVMLAGGVVEGAGALALGAAAVVLLTRSSAQAKKAAVAPWASGSVGGVEVRF